MSIFEVFKTLMRPICNIDDVRLIEWTCSLPKSIFQSGSNKHLIRHKINNIMLKNNKSKLTKLCSDDEITKQTKEIKLNICENHLLFI